MEEQSGGQGQEKQSVYCGIVIKTITSSPNFLKITFTNI